MQWESALQHIAILQECANSTVRTNFYPDNPQNYQISQLYQPIARNGYVEIAVGDTKGKKSVSMKCIWRKMPESWYMMNGMTHLW